MLKIRASFARACVQTYRTKGQVGGYKDLALSPTLNLEQTLKVSEFEADQCGAAD